jgi:hypothetical protein
VTPERVLPADSTRAPEVPKLDTNPDAKRSEPDVPSTAEPLLRITTPDAPREREPPDETPTAPLVTAGVPLLSTIAPLKSPVARPLAIISEPDEPLNVVPLLSTIDPLTPDDNAFALRIVMSPDDDDAPPPLTIATKPPVLDDDVVEPARSSRLPPTPLVVEPTSTETAPAEPLVATPVPTIT